MRFTVWGEVQAIGPDGAVQLGAKLRRLLAGLLVHRNGEASRTALIEILWGGESEVSDPEASLRLYVSRLRRVFRLVEPGSDAYLVTTPGGYRLNIPLGKVDSDLTHDAISGQIVDPTVIDRLASSIPYGSYAEESWCFRAVELEQRLAREALSAIDHFGWRHRVTSRQPATVRAQTHQVAVPLRSDRLVGRAQEVRQLLQLIADRSLVTVLGMGGLGKTRVALEAGLQSRPNFEGGVWFCDLAPVQTDRAVAHVIGTALGVGERTGQTITESIVAWIDQHSVLLVIDNCEQVIEGVAAFVEDILGRCPNVRIVATSREAVALTGEQRFQLGPLALPDAIELFVESARRLRPDFVLEAYVESVRAICEILDGIPLAIELAAAKTTFMAPPEIAAALNSETYVLADYRSRRPERHRTVAAAISTSLDTLAVAEGVLASRLGVFSGGFTFAAAGDICAYAPIDPGEAEGCLDRLVESSLVSMTPQADGTARFHMLEPVRQHVVQTLDAEDRHQVLTRHARWFALRAHALQELLLSPEEVAAAHQSSAEFGNFRRAHTWALANEPTSAAKIVTGLTHYMISRFQLEISDWFDSTLSVLDETDPWFAPTLAGATVGWAQRGRIDEVLEAARTVDRSRVPPIIRHNMALMVATIDRVTTGNKAGLEQVGEEAASDGDLLIATLALGRIGRVQEALDAAQRSNIPTALAWAEFFAGLHANGEPHEDEALTRFETAIAIGRTVGARLLLADALAHWAATAQSKGAARRETVRAAEESQAILRQAGTRRAGTDRLLASVLVDPNIEDART